MINFCIKYIRTIKSKRIWKKVLNFENLLLRLKKTIKFCHVQQTFHCSSTLFLYFANTSFWSHQALSADHLHKATFKDID